MISRIEYLESEAERARELIRQREALARKIERYEGKDDSPEVRAKVAEIENVCAVKQRESEIVEAAEKLMDSDGLTFHAALSKARRERDHADTRARQVGHVYP